MNADDLLKQMTEFAEISRSANPVFELDLRKALKAARELTSVTDQDVKALEDVLRNPGKHYWKELPPLPKEPLLYDPAPRDITFIKELISSGAKLWGVPATGQHYEIDHSTKTFKLAIDSEHDDNRVHDKTKMILGLLGWSMIDQQESTRTYSTNNGPWVVAVIDFDISTQINSKTGENFPPGTRGQDAVVTSRTGGLIRVGHAVGAELVKHVRKQYGTGKTAAAGQALVQKYGPKKP